MLKEGTSTIDPPFNSKWESYPGSSFSEKFIEKALLSAVYQDNFFDILLKTLRVVKYKAGSSTGNLGSCHHSSITLSRPTAAEKVLEHRVKMAVTLLGPL